MGDDDGRDSLVLADLPDEEADAVRDNGVQACGGLVIQQAFRRGDDGPGYGYALDHASGEAGRHFFLLPQQVHGVQGGGDARVQLLFIPDSFLAQREGDVFPYAEGVEECPLLEHEAYFTADLLLDFFRRSADAPAVYFHIAVQRVHQAVQMFQDDAFSSP